MLVNNAEYSELDEYLKVIFILNHVNEINTNILAPIHLTTLFLNLKSPDTIINVTSGLAFVQLSKVPVYCATKAFLRSFTLSLRHILKSRNIEVIEMIPPALDTDLGGKGIHDGQPPVSDFVEAVFSQMKEGKSELTFGFSEIMHKADPEVIRSTFEKMNP
ncbi:MAG: SDR family NAD(P)-dependent oxidoreductase [Ignavibacteria bacterium]